MAKRRIDLRRFKMLDTELLALENEGLDAATCEKIRSMYDVAAPDPHAWTKRIFLALTALAVLMLGMAAFLLVSENWKWLAPCWKTALVISALAVTLAGGVFARIKERLVLSELLFFASAILYGVGIWLIAQIFHISAHYPQGLWLWAIGVWILAFAVRTPILPIFAAILFALWGVQEVGFTGIGPGIWRDTFPTLPNAAWTLPVFSLVGWYFCRKRSRKIAAAFYYYAFFFWGILLCIALKMDEECAWFLVVWSLVFIFMRGFFGTQTLFSQNGFSPLMIKPVVSIRRFLRIFAAVSICPELFVLMIALLFVTVHELNVEAMKDMFHAPPAWCAVFLTVDGNLMALALSWLLMTRRTCQAGRCFALGILYFILWATIRYIDLFGDFFGYLGAAMFFALMAVTLFVGAFIWKKRSRRLAADSCAECPKKTKTPEISPEPVYLSKNGALTLILLAAIFQLGVLGQMIYSKTVGFRGAERITVETVPVDPRDMFRGDYVTLDYTFTQIRGERSVQVGDEWKTEQFFDDGELKESLKNGDSYGKLAGRTIYTVMEQRGEVWEPVKMTLKRPESGVFLKGYCDGWNVEYGIDTFYVPAGEGEAIEKARNSSGRLVPNEGEAANVTVLVDLWVAPNGAARIKNVRIEPLEPVLSAEKPVTMGR